MFELPQWSDLHPLVVHFPIALLLVVPIFLVLTLFNRTTAWAFSLSAFILMVIGTVGAVIAVQTGGAADDAMKFSEAVEVIVERHEHLAETVQVVFILLTVAFGLLLFLPAILHRTVPRGAWLALNGVFLVAYLVGCGYLVATGRAGGALTHGPGAPLASAQTQKPATLNGATAAPEKKKKSESDHD